MNKTLRSLTIMLTLIFTLTCMPLTAFAGKNDVTYPNATFVLTDKNGNTIDAQFDFFTNQLINFPEEGSKIRIFYDGKVDSSPDKEYTYHNGSFDDRGVLSPFRWEIKGGNYSNKTAQISVNEVNDRFNYERGYLYNINTNMSVRSVRAPMKSFNYSPALVNVPSEDIAVKAKDGRTVYNLEKRATHSNGKKSSFADGEKITVYFEDGAVKEYVNQVASETNFDMFVNNDGEAIEVLADNYLMKMGMNELVLTLLVRSELKTPTAKWKVYVKKTGEADYKEDPGTPEASSSRDRSRETAPTKKTATKNVSAVKIKNVKARRTGKKLSVSWKGLTKAQKAKTSKIQVQYGNSKQFINSTKIWVKKNQKKYVTKSLKKGKYYVRVRSMRKIDGKKYYSKWSAIKSVKIR